MKRDTRLSFALHALLHLAQRLDVSMTSGEMAEANCVLDRHFAAT